MLRANVNVKKMLSNSVEVKDSHSEISDAFRLRFNIRAIQIIRDTQGEGDDKMSHEHVCLFSVTFSLIDSTV